MRKVDIQENKYLKAIATECLIVLQLYIYIFFNYILCNSHLLPKFRVSLYINKNSLCLKQSFWGNIPRSQVSMLITLIPYWPWLLSWYFISLPAELFTLKKQSWLTGFQQHIFAMGLWPFKKNFKEKTFSKCIRKKSNNNYNLL